MELFFKGMVYGSEHVQVMTRPIQLYIIIKCASL